MTKMPRIDPRRARTAPPHARLARGIDDMPDKMFQCPIELFVKILAPDGTGHPHGHGYEYFVFASRVKCICF